MKKLVLSTLALFTMFFMTNAAMACGPDCKCGCNEGKPCTCQKVVEQAKCDCGCDSCKNGECKKCDCKDCECENCDCTKKADCGCKEGKPCDCKDCQCDECTCKKAQSECKSKKSFFGFLKKDKKGCCPVEQ